MLLIFDIVFIFFSLSIHTLSIYLALIAVAPFWQQSITNNALVIVSGYFIFLNAFAILTGLLRFLIQPRLKTGRFPVGKNIHYASYIINSLTHGIFLSSPFAKQCSFIFYLKYINFRLMGMKLPFSSVVSVESVIRQPELISIGSNTILGLGCKVSCHYSPNTKIHVQGRVIIGNDSVIGGYATIAPNVTIGNSSVVGANTSVFPSVKIGNKVSIGAHCIISHLSVIPDNVKIKSDSYIDRSCIIKPGETWGGRPAKKIS